MDWLNFISYFFGGAFLCNAVPHVVSGLTGHSFQSPFAKPPGQGLSSSTVNVVWGVLDLAFCLCSDLPCRRLQPALQLRRSDSNSGLGFLLSFFVKSCG